jgi:uncharacterized membrane protein
MSTDSEDVIMDAHNKKMIGGILFIVAIVFLICAFACIFLGDYMNIFYQNTFGVYGGFSICCFSFIIAFILFAISLYFFMNKEDLISA